ncbi:UDP-glucosyltransferase 2-like [Metopolophium dirhodum]|uniref:UDP-glucosyltransferase 2-like n=1 Tax=Metopolophium dirhodum TaxID=44670 RepID=UPI0029903B12|nr:UDP-glucosyltransferase 2-like [Metopolophium dirhodum]
MGRTTAAMMRTGMPLVSSAAAVMMLAFAVWPGPVPAGCARILAVETVGGRSHWNFMSGIIRALVDNGHTVTAFTPFLDGDRDNYTEVDISRGFPVGLNLDLVGLLNYYRNPFWTYGAFVEMGRSQCDVIYGSDEMRKLLQDRQQSSAAGFDAVLIESFWSECMSYAAARLGLPLIYVTPLPLIAFMEHAITGHVSNPAAVSNLMTVHAVPETFMERLSNVALLVCGSALQRYKELVLKYTEPPKEYDLLDPVPPSLVFVNRHFISDAPSPVPRNVVDVGGIHLKEAKSLQKDVLEFIEQSPHGVIYFSFGSTVKMSTIPESVKKALTKALARVPQRVLLKYEDKMEDKPKNMMTKQWLPQRDILLHPNVKLFISHGGISGLYEAVDAGVPVLGFPLVGDQPRNIDNLVNAGMAISMDLLSVTEDSFLNNVIELLNNKKYSESAKNAMKIFKDRPMSPESLVVYWTEYVLRHRGAPHLQSRALNLPWYQYYLLDVIGFAIAFISLIVFVIYNIFKYYAVYTKLLDRSRNVKAHSE